MKLVRLLASLILFGICLLPLSISAEVTAQLDPQTKAELEALAQQISEQTMSPFCPGRTISACPSSQARDLRQQIMKWLVQGYSPTAVRNQLISIYGDDVIGAPPKEGFGWVAWVTPALFVVVCLLLVAVKLRRLRSREGSSAKQPMISPEMEQRIAAELAQRR